MYSTKTVSFSTATVVFLRLFQDKLNDSLRKRRNNQTNNGVNKRTFGCGNLTGIASSSHILETSNQYNDHRNHAHDSAKYVHNIAKCISNVVCGVIAATDA